MSLPSALLKGKKSLIPSLFFAISCLAFQACSKTSHSSNDEPIVSMQLLDRNGFSETISSKDRLENYQKVDFSQPQPYEKVLRIFGKDEQKKSKSTITSYHSNGYLWQYLEIIDGRANGIFREYFPTGVLKIQAHVIEGMGDVSEKAQLSWLFEGKNEVYDELGKISAEIQYEKGSLQNASYYYYPSGKIWKTIPYKDNEIHGVLTILHEDGSLLESIEYQNGKKHGSALGYWKDSKPRYIEAYQNDLLNEASYFDPQGNLLGKIEEGNGKQYVFEEEKLYSTIQHKKGAAEGRVEIFHKNGSLSHFYTVRDGQKNGEEWHYYPSKEKEKPKLFLFWHEDAIQEVKTWYENGVMESQKRLNHNKKHGLSVAWFADSSVMFLETYEQDKLIKASYFEKGSKNPASTIENGKGIAMIYNHDGHFIKKIMYDKGIPVSEFY